MTSEAPEGTSEAPDRLRRAGPLRRFVVRALVTLAVIAGVLVLSAVILYSYGSMERPGVHTRQAFESMVAQGAADPLPRRFTIPIPGCRCHSPDPVLGMRHSTYRIRECRSCH